MENELGGGGGGGDSDESESGSGLENRNFGFNTPPDSPNAIAQFIRDQSLQYEGWCTRISLFSNQTKERRIK